MIGAHNALITKIKTIHSNDLSSNDYLELVKKRSITEIASYLKKHPGYIDTLGKIPEGSLNRSRLESLIRRQKFNQMMRIIKFLTMKDQSFYLVSLLHQEHEVLLAMIRSFISSENYDVVKELPVYFNKYSKIDFEAISKTTNLQTLVENLVNTKYYDMLKPYEKIKNEDLKYYEFESLFEADYYNYAFEHINKHFKGKQKQALENVFKSRIEIENITKIYRLKKFYKVSNLEIKTMLIIPNRLSEQKLDELLKIEDPNLILTKIIQMGDKTFVGDKDQIYLEYFTDHMRYKIANKLMYYSNHPSEVFLGYMILQDLEVKNLTHLIEGIRYQIPEEEIRTMMVF
ncbi:V-type ATPase subunit [Acholeplasma granularum]|uniref:V-type ATPase subunit n=1 Tax=Acholeplasma granularum TaxID=264635 RepID=UPI00046FFC4E|nr:V-type ATPase subunit [Acholeplasma granularum]